jgi:hypothetical protein
VITLTRLAVSFACAIGAASAIAFGQEGLENRAKVARAAEIDAFLAAFPKWTVTTHVSTGYGYNDNLLLSFTDEERSPFVRGSVEVFLMRVPDRFEFSFLADAEGTRYTKGDTVKDDAKIWISAEPAYPVGETLRFSMPVTGYYFDQVFDVSDTEVERIVAELKVKGAMIGPTVRWDFQPAWWLEAQGVAQQKRYDDHTYDGDIGEENMRLGWTRGWLEVRLTGAKRWRNFDSRAQYSAPAGRELPGTHLKVTEREGELRFKVTWDEAARWKTSSRVSVLNYRDNGSGYFNFREQKVAQELEWNGKHWQTSITGTASRTDFAVQTIGLGIDPPARLRDEFMGEFHVARMMSKRWTVFSTYTWERSRSNDPVACYTVNEGLLGVRWSWEK